jgi:Holliday junction DNA helicase RuvA
LLNNKIIFAHLRGTLLEKHPNQAVIEAGGIGYDVTIAVPAFTRLPDPGAEVRLFIHTHVREDAIALFGFLSREERTLFERLISVSGIGPKLAITVLSGLPANELASAIRRGAVERLVRVPGIGKKTAERIVLELREKMPAVEGEPAPADSAALSAVEQDVLSALVNLGCARPAAESAVRKAKATEGDTDFDKLFRKALELAR